MLCLMRKHRSSGEIAYELLQEHRGRFYVLFAKKIMGPLWEAASARFLLSYFGKQTYVHVFITASAYANMNSIFYRIEMQLIAELGYKIIWHYVK